MCFTDFPIALALTFALTNTLFAQERCSHTDLILENAKEILADRANLPRLKPANYRSDAAYLTLKYADRSVDEQFGFLNTLAQQDGRAARRLTGLTDAFTLTKSETL